MKATIMMRAVFVAAILVISALLPLSTSSAAPYFPVEEYMRPSYYDQIPGLWELLMDTCKIEWTEMDEAASEPNGDKEHACTTAGGTIFSGHVADSTDQNDYFMVTWTQKSSMFVRLSWTGSAWMNVYVYDANLQPITYQNENLPSPKHLSVWEFNPGTYYVRVKAGVGEADYQLKIGIAHQSNETQNDAIETTDWEISPYLEKVQSVVCTSADSADYFMVTIPNGCTGATISLDWFGTADANLDFEVYGPNGFILKTANSSTQFESAYSQNVPANTYFIAVKAITGKAMYQLAVDAEIDLKIEIPRWEFPVEINPWDPPFQIFGDFDPNERIVLK